MSEWLRNALWDQVPRDHRDTPQAHRRRQVVTGLVVVLGGIVLGLSLRLDPGSPAFYAGSLTLSAVSNAPTASPPGLSISSSTDLTSGSVAAVSS